MSGSDEEMSRASSRVTDIAAAIVLVAISLFVLIWVVPANVGQDAGGYDVTPAFFPNLTAATVLILSSILIVLKWMSGSDLLKDWHRSRGGLRIIAETNVWLVVAAAVYVGVSQIGFLPTASLLIVGTALLCQYRTYWIIGMLAVACPIAVDQLAWLIFTVDLP